MSSEQESPLAFQSTEKEFYLEQVDTNTADILSELEHLRPSLTTYPQSFRMVADAVKSFPFVDNNNKFDAFYAKRLAMIIYTFAKTINDIGFSDETDPHLELQEVDLSAAKKSSPDVPAEIDDTAVRESFMDSGVSDEEVAGSANVADDAAIRSSDGGVNDVEDAIGDLDAQFVREVLEELGVGLYVENSSDDAEDVSETGGSHSVQTGLLDPAGSSASPDVCGINCARLLLRAVLEGTRDRPGLAQRLHILTQYGEMTKAEIDLLIDEIYIQRQEMWEIIE